MKPPTDLERRLLTELTFERFEDAEKALESALERIRLSQRFPVLGVSTGVYLGHRPQATNLARECQICRSPSS